MKLGSTSVCYYGNADTVAQIKLKVAYSRGELLDFKKRNSARRENLATNLKTLHPP